MTTSDLTELRETFANVPVHRLVGLRLESQSREQAVVVLDVSKDLTQQTGVLQGGVLSALADAAAVHLFLPYLAEHQLMTSIEFKMNFLRPVRVAGGAVTARSSALHRGRKVGVAEVEVTQASQLVAKGLFTYLFMGSSEWSDTKRD